jgi:hypothetical protein
MAIIAVKAEVRVSNSVERGDGGTTPTEFPDDCLVGKHACPVIYYVAGWLLCNASKALTVARDKRLLFLDFLSLSPLTKIWQRVWIFQLHL